MTGNRADSVDQYLQGQPLETRALLEEIRSILHAGAPGAIETISYSIPALRLDQQFLFYFAGWKRHVSMYPVTTAVEFELGAEIEPYRKGSGTLQFKLDEPLPVDLIRAITRVRVREIRSKAKQ